MLHSLRDTLARLVPGPLLRLLLASGLLVVLVQPGSFGQADALFRYQATRWLWTGEPPTTPEQVAAGFVLVGRDGLGHGWWGIGHSAWMLPFDIVAAGVAAAARGGAGIGRETAEYLRQMLVGAGSNLAAALIGISAVYWLVVGLGYGSRTAVACGLTLVTGTTFLHYAQVAQENNLMLALTVLALALSRWSVRSGKAAGIVCAGFVLGFGVTIRLPYLLCVAAVAGVLAAWRWAGTADRSAALRAMFQDALRLSPGIAAGLAADRLYHFARFGSWQGTYMGLYAKQMLERHPTLPPGYPFSIGLVDGLKVSVFSPDRLPFLYDPLALVAVLLPVIAWRRFAAPLRPVILAAWVILLGNILFHARYYFGDAAGAWGPRFVVTWVQLLILAVAPQVIHAWPTTRRLARLGIAATAVAALGLQIASVCFSPTLEAAQKATGNPAEPLVRMRFRNVAGLTGSGGPAARVPDGYDARIGVPNLAPFVFAYRTGRGIGSSPIVWIWLVGLGVLAWRIAVVLPDIRLSTPPAPGTARPPA